MDEITILAMLITTILGILSISFGIKYRQAKTAIREIVDALEDDKVTKKEFVNIVQTIKKLLY